MNVGGVDSAHNYRNNAVVMKGAQMSTTTPIADGARAVREVCANYKTQDEVAALTGLSQPYISQLRRGERPLTLRAAHKLERGLGLESGRLTTIAEDIEAMPGYLIYPGHRTLRPTVRSRRLTLRANLV